MLERWLAPDLLRPQRMTRNSCLGLLVATLMPLSAHAAENPCGNVEYQPFECHLELGAYCRADCEPIAFVAACDGQCNLPPDDACIDSCESTCLSDCEGAPIDCFSHCTDDCSASLADTCDDACADRESCQQDCATQCSDAGAGCAGACATSCSAVCENLANRECTADCRGGLGPVCESLCDRPDGALFCDGQLMATALLCPCLDALGMSLPEAQEEPADGGCSVAHTSGSGLAAGLALAAVAFGTRRRRAAIS